MNYKAMPGSIIIEVEEKTQVSKQESGLFLVEKTEKAGTTIANVISVGDEREDLKEGMKILFPTNTGLLIAKNTYFLKYEDICAIVS